jgi:2-phosphosulfolactate phosphatase
MRVHVAFTPSEAATADLGIVVDVVRATSTIAQALASGYRRVLCCAEVEQARALRASLPDVVVGGERDAVRIEGFDVGASPREFLEPLAETLVLSTTNGTRAILAAAERCGEVVLGSLLNLDAVAALAREGGGDVAILCAGFKGTFAFDDAYCAGRIVAALGDGGQRTDAAIAATLVASAFPRALDGLNARTYGPPGLEADIEWCARESVLDVVPRLGGVTEGAAEIAASSPPVTVT